MTLDIEVTEDGTIRAVYDDELQHVGALRDVVRLSHVEWEGEGWTVRAAHDPDLALRTTGVSREGALLTFTSRAEALAAERAHAWELTP